MAWLGKFSEYLLNLMQVFYFFFSVHNYNFIKFLLSNSHEWENPTSSPALAAIVTPPNHHHYCHLELNSTLLSPPWPIQCIKLRLMSGTGDLGRTRFALQGAVIL